MQQIVMIIMMFLVTGLFWVGQLVPGNCKNSNKLFYRSGSTAAITNLLLFSIFIFYFALREVNIGVGGLDTIVYKERFLSATGNIWNSIFNQGNEIGYALFVYIIRLFTSNFKIFLIIYYLILLLLANNINRNIKRTAVSFPLTMIFITLNIFLSVCLMRNQLSCFLAYNSLLYFSKKKYKSCGAYFICAVSCHISAVILLVGFFFFYLYNNRHWSISMLICCVVITCIAILIGGAALGTLLKDTKYSMYFTSERNGAVGFGQLVRFIAVLVIYFSVFYNRQGIRRRRVSDIHLMLLLAIFCCFPMQIYVSIVYRMFSMVAFSQLELLNDSYDMFASRQKNCKTAVIVVAFLIMAAELYLFFQSSVPSYGLLPIRFEGF